MTTTVAAKEKPILFSAPMVQAILEGRKTQTRRVIKPQPNLKDRNTFSSDQMTAAWQAGFVEVNCPYGNRGGVLWVREAFSYNYHGAPKVVHYWADGNATWGDWTRPKPSIHLPREFCRIRLEIVEVRVQRLQEISPADAKAEGDIERSGMPEYHDRGAACHVDWFRNLWNGINGKSGNGWDRDPFVWVIEFKRRS